MRYELYINYKYEPGKVESSRSHYVVVINKAEKKIFSPKYEYSEKIKCKRLSCIRLFVRNVQLKINRNFSLKINSNPHPFMYSPIMNFSNIKKNIND